MHFTPPLAVDAHDAAVLGTWIRDGRAGSARVRRAQIVLLSAEGLGATAIADRLCCSRQTVVSWRNRYRAEGLPGLVDSPRSGRPATVDAVAVIIRTLQPPPTGTVRWSTRLLADELGISNAAVANVWRTWGLVPGSDGILRLATEPALDAAVDGVVGMCAASTLRILVVRHGDPAATGLAVPDRCTALGSGLADVEREPAADPGCAALTAFLDRLDLRHDGRAGHRGLVAGNVPAVVARWADRQGVTLHAVPETRSWARLAHLACILAAGTPRGAAAEATLGTALARADRRRPLSWVAECEVLDKQSSRPPRSRKQTRQPGIHYCERSLPE
jgi:transposase